MERSTRQGTAIRAVVDAAGRPLSLQEVGEAVQHEVPALSMARAYRRIKALLDAGEGGTVEPHDLTLAAVATAPGPRRPRP